jgi:hypothetical protein
MPTVAEVLSPVLALVGRRLEERDGDLRISDVLESRPSMLTIMCLQAAEAFAANGSILECRFAGCAGAPDRPRWFLFKTKLTGTPQGDLWEWKKRTATRDRRRGDDYCSPECASAASTAAERERRKANPRKWSANEREIRQGRTRHAAERKES